MTLLRAAACGGLTLLLVVAPAGAQIRSSERGAVSQTVDGTVITVDYARPQIRGRDSIFGTQGKAVVYWGEIWTPGANWATTLELNRPVKLNGQDVPAGKYSMWFVPAQGEWTVNLHKNPRLFHTNRPKADEWFLSLKVTPQTAPARHEVLEFDFPAVRRDGATLRLQWADVVLPLEVTVTPSRPERRLSDAQMAPYVGSYTLRSSDDTTSQKAEVIAANGGLSIVVDGWGGFSIRLLPTDRPHRFESAFAKDGQIVDVEDQAPLTFDMQGNKATGFTVMDLTENKPWMTGKRRA